jgi:hypothetical protein
MDVAAFVKFRDSLPKERSPLYDIALGLRHGLTDEQIANENPTLPKPQVRLLIQGLEKKARRATRGGI